MAPQTPHRPALLFVCTAMLAALPAATSYPGASALAQTHPVPLINQPLVPGAALPGGAGFTLTVNGTGFASGAVVKWNGASLATTFVSGSQLKAAVPASDTASPGTASITVTNPGPGAAASNVVFFEVVVPASAVTFSASTVATGQYPEGIVAADFNGDGKIDLAVANGGDGTVSILLGNGDGTFAPRVDYPAGFAGVLVPMAVIAGDFNNDGKLDLAVGSSVLLGNGNGTFQPAISGPLDGSLAADFNGDGKLDLAALTTDSAGVSTIEVALGNGDGTFQAPISSATAVQVGATGLLSMSAGDFNGDGKLDVAVGGQFIDGEHSGNLFVQLGNGDGTFQAPSALDTSSTFFFNPTWTGFGDFTGDGMLDLAVTSCFTRDTLAASYPIFLGQGNGAFTAGVGGTAPNNNQACPASGTIGDLNGDGKLDLVAVNPPPFYVLSADDNTVSVLLGNGDGSLQSPVEFVTGSSPVAVVAADFNGDGRQDLAVVNSGDNTVSILLQQAPTLHPSPATLAFNDTYVSATSPAQTVTVTNISDASLEITQVSTSGDFGETNDCGTLAAGAGCTVSVTFTPAAEGMLAGTLTISYNGPNSPLSVPLSGTGSPDIVLSTTQLNFGYHEIGTTAAPQTVTVTNAGVDAISIGVAPLGITGYSQTNNCGTLAPGASCLVTVTFTPNAATLLYGGTMILDVYHELGGLEFYSEVFLTGTATTAAIVSSPSSLVFGGQAVGTTSLPQTITFANAGAAPFAIRAIRPIPEQLYQQTNNCPAILAGGTSCTINVSFTPTSRGHRAGFILVVGASRPGPAQLVRLMGTGE